MHKLKTPNQKIIAKFKSNKLSLMSLFFIGTMSVFALFAYQIIPDSTTDANIQNPSIAMQSPGFSMQFLKLKKEIKQQNGFWEILIFGSKPDYKLLAIEAARPLSNNTIRIKEFKGEAMTSIGYEMSSEMLYDNRNLNYNLVKKTFYLGTDNQGRDVLSRLILGSRVSMMVGFVAVLISSFIGICIGSLAGYYRGWIDKIIVWKMSVFWSIPTLLLSMALYISLKDFFNSTFFIIFIAIGFTMWVSMARMVRGQLLGIKEIQFVEAANSLGYSNFRIIIKHILPNIMGPVIVVAASSFANAILIESGLSFLGLGIQPPTPSWGGMLNEYKNFIGTNLSYLALFPGVMIMMLVLSFNLVGNGLRDALDIRN